MTDTTKKLDIHAFIRKPKMALYALISYCILFLAFCILSFFFTNNTIVVTCILFLIAILLAKLLSDLPIYGIGICAFLIFITGLFVKQPLLTLFSMLLFIGAFGVIHMIRIHGGFLTK